MARQRRYYVPSSSSYLDEVSRYGYRPSVSSFLSRTSFVRPLSTVRRPPLYGPQSHAGHCGLYGGRHYLQVHKIILTKYSEECDPWLIIASKDINFEEFLVFIYFRRNMLSVSPKSTFCENLGENV